MQSSIAYLVTDYNKYSNLDTQFLSISNGVSWRSGKFVYSIPFIINTQKVGHGQKYYFIAKGLSPQMSYQIDKDFLFTGSLSLQNKRYHKNADKESNSVTLNTSFKYLLDDSSYVNTSLYLGKENSHTLIESNDSKGLSIEYFKALSSNLSLYTSASISTTDYEGVEVAYNKTREDTNKRLGLSLSYLFSDYKINSSLSFNYTNNSSNIEIYDYDRTQISLTFSKSF